MCGNSSRWKVTGSLHEDVRLLIKRFAPQFDYIFLTAARISFDLFDFLNAGQFLDISTSTYKYTFFYKKVFYKKVLLDWLEYYKNLRKF